MQNLRITSVQNLKEKYTKLFYYYTESKNPSFFHLPNQTLCTIIKLQHTYQYSSHSGCLSHFVPQRVPRTLTCKAEAPYQTTTMMHDPEKESLQVLPSILLNSLISLAVGLSRYSRSLTLNTQTPLKSCKFFFSL